MQENIQHLVKNKQLLFSDTNQLMLDVAGEYAFTMNSIIFDKYLQEGSSDLVPHSLVLPPQAEKGEVPYYGLLPTAQGPEVYMYNPYEIFKVPQKEFTEIFKEFCIISFLTTPEAITVLQEVRGQCNAIRDFEFFNLTPPQKPFRVEDFQREMEVSYTKVVDNLKTVWQPAIKTLIEKTFEKSDKSWLSLTNKTDFAQYEHSKLKKFLNLVMLMMQDSLLSLCQKGFKNYVDFISQFTPDRVEIGSSSRVDNFYRNGSVLRSLDPQTQYSFDVVHPLFQLELMRTQGQEDDGFQYSKSPQSIVQTIQVIFDKLVDDLNKIPHLERELLHNLFRKFQPQLSRDSSLKAPQRNKNKAQTFQSAASTDYDENLWLDQLYEKLSADAQLIIAPLEEYLRKFDPYREVLKINPEELIKEYDNEEKPVEVERIREDIRANQAREKKLRQEIPESIQISCFLIKSKDIVK